MDLSPRSGSDLGAHSPPAAVVSAVSECVATGDFSGARALLRRVGVDLMPDERRRIVENGAAREFKRIIFICGLHRSGTSLLEQHLSANYEACRLRARVPENEGQFLQDVYAMERPYGGPGHFAFYEQTTGRALTDPALAASHRARLLQVWSPWLDGDGDVLIEKSPPNLVRIAYLRSVFPQARFIIWTRDPRAVTLATRKWTSTAIPLLMMHWNVAYMKAMDVLADDCIIASYERFCAAPQVEMRRLAEFCGLRRRGTPLPVAPKFRAIVNRNREYLDVFPKYWNRAWIKAWDILGYRLD